MKGRPHFFAPDRVENNTAPFGVFARHLYIERRIEEVNRVPVAIGAGIHEDLSTQFSGVRVGAYTFSGSLPGTML